MKKLIYYSPYIPFIGIYFAISTHPTCLENLYHNAASATIQGTAVAFAIVIILEGLIH